MRDRRLSMSCFSASASAPHFLRVRHGRGKDASWVHMVTLATTLAFALFVIADIEFARLGIVQVAYFDHFLDEV